MGDLSPAELEHLLWALTYYEANTNMVDASFRLNRSLIERIQSASAKQK